MEITPTPTKRSTRSGGRTTRALTTLAAAFFMLGTLLAFAGPADASDNGPTFGVEEEEGYNTGVACGPIDNQGNSTCVDHDCSPVSGECTALWYCMEGSGGISLGACGSKPSTSQRGVDSLTAVGDPEPAKKAFATRR